MTPKEPDERLYDEPVMAKKWRNLQFWKGGMTSLGLYVHNSESDAKNAAMKLNQNIKKGTITYVCGDKGCFPVGQYLYSVPMPVGE